MRSWFGLWLPVSTRAPCLRQTFVMGACFLTLLAESACIGTSGSDSGRRGEPGIVILSPSPFASAIRDQRGEHQARIAPVDIELEVSGLDSVELWADGVMVGGSQVGDTSMNLTAAIESTGSVVLEARGLASDDTVIASTETTVEIKDPNFSCIEWLDFFAIDYQRAGPQPGIETPINVMFPLLGIEYRYNGSKKKRDNLLGDCTLIHALAESTSSLLRRNITMVIDIGVYNYRCIGGGKPPNCPNGISQHAYATAIDIAGYQTADGATYIVNDDWVIDPDEQETCAADTENDNDRFLHETICEQKRRGIWNIVLTPNFNSAHRNHFHVDLTKGADFTNFQVSPHNDPYDSD